MKAKIYRGTKEIGGTCVELKADNGRILWIDLGMPLDKSNPNIDYVRENKPDALLISHPHLDHYGLMEFVNQDTPVYIGSVSRELINAPRIFLNFPFIKKDFRIMEPWKTFVIAETFKITPYLVDHSSPEAFAFLIEADEKRIFYSGDFRATGRKKILFENLIKKPPPNIDLLLLEGTMIERENKGYKNEDEIELAFVDLFKKQKNISIVISSAQNIDRFVSVVRACKQTGKKVVIDIYNAWVLEKVKEKSSRLPTIDWKEVLVYKSKSQLKKISGNEYADFRNRIDDNSIENKVFANPSNYVYFMRCPSETFLDALKNNDKINLIYSQWEGYLKEEYKMYFTETINKIRANENDFNFKVIHTSGHATIKDLLTFSHSLKPKKIVPIHTQFPQKMKEEFENDGMKNVYLWDDNKEYELNIKKMANYNMRFLRMAKELNEKYHEELKRNMAHFRGNINSISLISIAKESSELGVQIKNIKNIKEIIDNFKPSYSNKENPPSKKEKDLQAWIIKYALNNNFILPLKNNLTFITSELAFPNVIDKYKKGKCLNKIVNDILAVDSKNTLCVIELKSQRLNEVKEQSKDFENVILHSETEKDFFRELVKLYTGREWNGKCRKISVWPQLETHNIQKEQSDIYKDVEEINYTQNDDGYIFE